MRRKFDIVFLSVVLVIVSVLFCSCTCNGKSGAAEESKIVWLDELDVSKAFAGWGSSKVNKSVDGNVLTINAVKYERGIGTHSAGQFNIKLNKDSVRFTGLVGVDYEIAASPNGRMTASIEFVVLGDDKLLWRSGVMKAKTSAKAFDIDVSGVDILRLLVSDGGDSINYDHADWVDAKFVVLGKRPIAIDPVRPKPYILTPKPGPKPHLTGAKIFGVRPGSEFLFTVTATGKRPMKFAAKDLPEGLSLDAETGRITGFIERRGEYKVKFIAENNVGRDERDFKIVVGDTICLTPPMGWNSWNCWGCAVDDEKVRATARAMVDTGLINHGWTYINIDDCWMRKPNSEDEIIGGTARDEDGMILTNKKFPDMYGLCDYIHSLGLKAGTYIGPGPLTCQRFEASYNHEAEDAAQFAAWGFDYLKYDWCYYSQVAKDDSLEELKKPYILMKKHLDAQPRDIVYSLCQYGMGEVWKWGAEVGGNCWRTTGDISDSWGSMAGIGFGQANLAPYAGPGHWNDPDMLVVGNVGWGPQLHPANLTPDEQYTHISLWCLLSSPLLIGCPIEEIDDFTLNLLTNDEVLEVNQDALGQQARRILKQEDIEVWAKDMEDGSKAVGLFNRNDFKEQKVTVGWTDLKIQGKHRVRDLWRQKDIGVYKKNFSMTVPIHGVVLVRIFEK
jgi:alpha-galactosidase